MTNEELEKSIFSLGRQLLLLDAGLSELKAAVHVLQRHAVRQLRPDRRQAALKALQEAQAEVVAADSHAQDTKKALEALDAAEQWKKKGGGPASRA